MALSSGDIKQILIEKSDEFKKLYDKHQNFEKRLSQLHGRLYLTSAEELEVTEIKKKKLNLKDRMQLHIERYRAGGH